jgi:hypothetical protein
MTPIRSLALPTVVLAALSACGGGGGNTLQPDPGPLPAGAPSQAVVMSGISQTANATNNGTVVESWNNSPVDASNSNVTLVVDGEGYLSSFSINTPQSSVSFNASEINCDTLGACAARNATSLGVVMDSDALGWNYQSFGVWLKDLTATSFQAGAISVGEVTPASGLPIGLTNAQFTGQAGGFYVDGAGSQFITDAKMNAVVNFAERNINFSTTGTLLTHPTTFVHTPNSNLDLTGNWTYGSSTSQFSGTLRTQDSSLSGNASGRFYGPNAEEIGGVYGLTSATDRSRMVGGFGGKRP